MEGGKYDGVSDSDMLDDIRRSRLSKSDWQRDIAPLSLQTLNHLCAERKCIRKAGHPGSCWPTG